MPVPARRQQYLSDISDWLESWPPFLGWRAAGQLQPIRVEEYTEGDDYVVRAEVPGVDPERDLEVSVQHGMLSIRAERSEEKTEKNRSEFRYGSFHRTVSLPDGADDDSVRAGYADGILTVRVRIGQPAREAKKVNIERGS